MIHRKVFDDNTGSLKLAQSPKMTPRTKHISVKYHWLRYHIGEYKGIVLHKIESESQNADIFTKGLTLEVFTRIRNCCLVGKTVKESESNNVTILQYVFNVILERRIDVDNV